MAEKIVSPGVFTNEVDQSYLPSRIAAIGAAVVGPTQKGPAGIPTTVSSYSEFLQVFGGVFTSGSGASEQSYKYLTNYAAQEYLKYADTLTVVRVLGSGYAPATSSVQSSASLAGQAFASASITFTTLGSSFNGIPGNNEGFGVFDSSGNAVGIFVSASIQQYVYSLKFGRYSGSLANAAKLINDNVTTLGLSASFTATSIQLTSSIAGTSYNGYTIVTGSSFNIIAANYTSASATFGGGASTPTNVSVFTLTTLADGADQNSASTEGTNNILSSGSANNIRWEVTSRNENKGTFNLILRRGDDTSNRKVILEQYNNLTLDPNSPNYIAHVIGDQYYTLSDSGGSDPYLQLTGDFVNRSKYVRVTVLKNTVNYLDANGAVRDSSLSYLIPKVSSGSFGSGNNGTEAHPKQFNENIDNTNTQGFNLGIAGSGKNAYIDAIRLLKNQDEYDINLLTLPGLFDNFTNHATVLTEAVNMVESRGDCFLVYDPVEHGQSISQAVTKAEARDTNYASVYWPWIKIPDADLGKNVWVPASTVIPGVYAFNDRVAAPWFAPAGLNRGGIDIAVQTERKLTHSNRDTLYESAVNPIATFPNSGVVVFGQKTLQKKASALDRVNVRRLLIAAKKFIASTTKYLVFENNTAATRNRFLSIANPYFENIQQRQGLYAFKVVMDETTNTPDVIDRNEMRGQIFLQPAKTAEFIIVDFNILPTGASFPE
jgi:phage tail sheath protein FI